ncbi:MAG: Tn3 family transposase [Acetobacteraceae bacterium]|nr:Tn3 family transposase [Acetobacteraceae bacterium]
MSEEIGADEQRRAQPQVRAYDLLRMLGRDGGPSPLGQAFADYGRIAKTLHLPRLSPLGDKRINLLGRYAFAPPGGPELRPLRDPASPDNV